MRGSTIDVGIDIGKRRLAYAWPAYGERGSIDLESQHLSRSVELRWLQNWLTSHIPADVQLWVDQAYAGNGAVATAQALEQTIAAVLTAQEWVTEPQIVHQATWKSQVVGNHMASKIQVHDWLAEHHPELMELCSCEDEVDAMVIAIYGKGRSDGVINAPVVKKPRRRKKA